MEAKAINQLWLCKAVRMGRRIRIWVTKNPAAPRSQAERMPFFLCFTAKTASTATGRAVQVSRLMRMQTIVAVETIIILLSNR